MNTLTLNLDPFPELTTERLLLRRIMADDVSEIYRLRSDLNVMKYIGKDPVKSIDEAADFIQRVDESLENNSGITWAISLSGNTERLIGTLGLWRVIKEHFRAEAGYMLMREYWCKGIIREALKAALDYGFFKIGLHSVEAQVNPRNIVSAKLLERAGFVREAYLKENFFYKGTFEDTAIYSLLAPRSVPGINTSTAI